MTLKEYFKKHPKITKTGFADRIGLRNYTSLYKWMDGENFPSPKFIKAIQEETKGKVTANDFYA